jgi:hypothetical protein
MAAEDDVTVPVNSGRNDRFRARSGGNRLFETMKALVIKKNFESHCQESKSVFMLVVLVIFAHDHVDKCDDDQNEKTNEKRRGVN